MSNSIDESLWDQVTVLKKNKSQLAALNKQKRSGNTETVSKNKNQEYSQKMYSLENDSESLKHDKVKLSVGKELAKLRTQKKISQKVLATQLNINVKEINDIESGKSLNNKKLISRIRNHLQKK